MIKRKWPYLLPSVLVAGGIGVAACAGPGPTEPPGSEPSFQSASALSAGFVRCTRQAAAKAEAYIGPAGGTIRAGFGTLKIPPGALSATRLIKLEALSDTINSVRLSPHGLIFSPTRQATLTIATKNCSGMIGRTKTIVYISENLQLLSVLPSAYSSLTESVSTPLSHFSRYAVHR